MISYTCCIQYIDTHISLILSFYSLVYYCFNSGLGALELISMELKHAGIYVARSLSYQNCQFTSINAELTTEQIAMYDAATIYWQRLKKAEAKAITLTGLPAREWQIFWNTFTRFFKCLCISLKLPTVFREAKQALLDGMSVVIGLQTTAEAALKHELELKSQQQTTLKGRIAPIEHIQQTLKEFPCLCKLMVSKFLLTHFPTRRLEKVAVAPVNTLTPNTTSSTSLNHTANTPRPTSNDPYSYYPSDSDADDEDDATVEFFNKRFQDAGVEPTLTAQVNVEFTEYREEWVEIPELVQLRAQLLQDLEALQLPPAPIDLMIDELGGTQNVAELTGRTGRMVRNNAGQIIYEPRIHQKSNTAIDTQENLQDVNIAEKNDFMNDKKRVAIISDAASTGISLHSDLSCKNQRRRLHITVELSWSADKTIQQLGRTHRSNEASGPIYMLVTTKVAGTILVVVVCSIL